MNHYVKIFRGSNSQSLAEFDTFEIFDYEPFAGMSCLQLTHAGIESRRRRKPNLTNSINSFLKKRTYFKVV